MIKIINEDNNHSVENTKLESSSINKSVTVDISLIRDVRSYLSKKNFNPDSMIEDTGPYFNLYFEDLSDSEAIELLIYIIERL